MNILTSTGLVERYVTDWAGPDTDVTGIAIRLGAPAYPYDTLTFTGEVSRSRTASRPWRSRARSRSADHVIGTVKVALLMGALSGQTAIAGIGATEFSKESGRSELQLSVEAVRARARGRRPLGRRRRRPDDVHDGHLLRDRGGPRARHRGAALLQPDQLRRRRRLRHRPAGRDGGRHRRRRRRGRLPRLQRAFREPVRPVLGGGGDPGEHQRPRQRVVLPAWASAPRPRPSRCRPAATCTSTAPPPPTSVASRSPTAGTRPPTRTPSSTASRSPSRTTRPRG